MSKALIVIPCCGSKIEGGDRYYYPENSVINFLSNEAGGYLLDLRRKIFLDYSLPSGRDIGMQDEEEISYMEAYKRYTGNRSQIYGQISFTSWEKLINSSNLDLVIVSALYGLLKYDESIRNYNAAMKDTVAGRKLKTWWRKNGLCTILKNYISKNKILEMHFVLFADYNEALEGFETVVKSTYYDFSSYKSGSNSYRGKWVDDFMRNF